MKIFRETSTPVNCALTGTRRKRYSQDSLIGAHRKDTYEKPLAKQLEVTGAAQDPDVVAAAQQVIQAANAAGVKIRYQTNISGGRNVVGEHGRYIENAAPGVAGAADSAE